MNLRDVAKHPIGKWVFYFGVWTVVGLFWSTRLYILYKDHPTLPITWLESMILGLIEWYLWAIFSVLIFKVCAHFPLDREHWKAATIVHTVIAVAGSLLLLAAYNTIDRPIDEYFMQAPKPPEMATWTASYYVFLSAKFHGAIMTYALIALLSYALSFYQRYKREELQASELRAELAGAQLHVLKSQLHPHFLFNALHTISSLMHEDVDAADNMIGRLGDLLRRSLRRVNDQTVPLREELEFAERYLEIERVRFSDRMQIEFQVQAEVLNASVPNLILHPLVENAVRHGISGTVEGGTVKVVAERDGNSLKLVVSDNGAAATKAHNAIRGEGIGLTNTRERLQRLYRDQYQFAIENGAGSGFTVTIRIPLQQHPEAASQT